MQEAGALYHLTAFNSKLNHAFKITVSALLTMKELKHNTLRLQKCITEFKQNLEWSLSLALGFPSVYITNAHNKTCNNSGTLSFLIRMTLGLLKWLREEEKDIWTETVLIEVCFPKCVPTFKNRTQNLFLHPWWATNHVDMTWIMPYAVFLERPPGTYSNIKVAAESPVSYGMPAFCS